LNEAERAVGTRVPHALPDNRSGETSAHRPPTNHAKRISREEKMRRSIKRYRQRVGLALNASVEILDGACGADVPTPPRFFLAASELFAPRQVRPNSREP
jgi:hypothetical protein